MLDNNNILQHADNNNEGRTTNLPPPSLYCLSRHLTPPLHTSDPPLLPWRTHMCARACPAGQHVKMSIKLGEKNVIKGRKVMEEEIAKEVETIEKGVGGIDRGEEEQTNAQCAKL